ncbi:MAG: EamA family transporter [Actinobacteria bacterium]|uniref:Unannotated protein n=1 Tax=freshwater metagenome TaxID=449393 RepID=A0A6J7P4U9_9ZZZZ|nr:EamA family transporter [Actinomycetota bacterium]
MSAERARANAVARPPVADLAWLGVAVLAISTSGPVIAACAAPALAIALWRCVLGAGATAPFVAWRRRGEVASLTRREWRLALVSGLLLGAHLATWVPSLRFTSVASATALVATQPVWAVVIARMRGAVVRPKVWVGIAIALAGVLVVTGIDVSREPRALVGDGLALAGAVFMAINVTVGQEVRQSVSTATYTTISYGSSGVALLVLCVALQVPLGGYSARDWWLILGLTAIAQLVGHTLINRVLATTPATVTSLAILLEVPGATLIAAWWLGEVPPLVVLPGIVLLFAGLTLVILAGDRRLATEAPPI